jgi:protein-disulfide isomerase
MNPKNTPHPHEETFTIKRSTFYMLLVALAFGVGLLVGYAWGSNGVSPVAAQPAPQADLQAMAPTPIPQRVDVPTEGYPSLGPANAPITIVEFSDFQCPYCRKFHMETYQALLDAYPGQIRFVYRNLPLTSMHPEAFPSAVASLCAQDQEAFWPFYEKLFSSDELGRSVYLNYAVELELDTAAFETCLDSGRHDDFIQADSDYALSIGVNSTPTFFVNGAPVVGAYPLEYFKQVIDEELVKNQ